MRNVRLDHYFLCSPRKNIFIHWIQAKLAFTFTTLLPLPTPSCLPSPLFLFMRTLVLMLPGTKQASKQVNKQPGQEYLCLKELLRFFFFWVRKCKSIVCNAMLHGSVFLSLSIITLWFSSLYAVLAAYACSLPLSRNIKQKRVPICLSLS